MSRSLAPEPLSPGLSGVAGEYFVAAELSRRGFIASVTLRNARGIDVLVAHQDGNRFLGIQVKTNQHSQRSWPLHEKVESSGRPDLFFVFVNLNGSGEPTYHVVPSAVVAEYCRSSHAAWLARPGKGGRLHRDNPVREFKDVEGRYLAAWGLLESVNGA
jgi:hypothetical protein